MHFAVFHKSLFLLPSLGPSVSFSLSSRSNGHLSLRSFPRVVQEPLENLTSMHLALNIAELGISLISESLRQELCFAEVSQLALGFQQKGERQKLLLRLADIQIDNQLCNAQKPVLLANRGGAGGGSTDDVSLSVWV